MDQAIDHTMDKVSLEENLDQPTSQEAEAMDMYPNPSPGSLSGFSGEASSKSSESVRPKVEKKY